MSAYISRQRKSTKELSLFLLTRGFWLVLLEFTVVRLGITFNLYYDFLIFQVIWVIGASMIVLAALVYLPQRVILAIGLVLVLGHNLFDLMQVQPDDNGYVLWAILQQSGTATLMVRKFYSNCLSPDSVARHNVNRLWRRLFVQQEF